jgi:peptide/nickel transport system permease protein
MARYIVIRLGWTVVVLWAIATLTFAATFLSPIDPAKSFAGLRATNQQIQVVRHEFGLDRPIYVQYVKYLGRLVRGNLGTSYEYGSSVGQMVMSALPKTALLAFSALIVELAIGLPLGLIAGLNRGRLIDRIVLIGTLLGVVVPSFVLGFVLLYLLAYKLGWFPLGGSDSFSALILPAFTLGVAGGAWYARMLRSTVLNIIGEDYVRLARAKGLSERVVIGRHVLRNAVSPIIAMIALDLGVFLGGVLVIERVFAWPGIGLQAWEAIEFNDIPVVMGTVLIAAAFIVLLNLLADLVNAFIDPRVRYS